MVSIEIITVEEEIVEEFKYSDPQVQVITHSVKEVSKSEGDFEIAYRGPDSCLTKIIEMDKERIDIATSSLSRGKPKGNPRLATTSITIQVAGRKSTTATMEGKTGCRGNL
ncbi:hypothetical protein GOP47_0027791 [Adiantum capillus-veneris]|nr:hypothetical protein GOP47_0027791 [Adiantum capillus-veneris]